MVMRGAGGKAFASGADISEFEAVRGDAAAEAEYSRRTGAARARLDALGKPLIAMIDGYCIGGGCAMAMAADIRIASEPSRFGIPAARLGVSYAYESLHRLVQLVGPAYAKEIMFTGRQLDAAEALAMGLVNRVVPVAELEATVVAMAASIARNAPLSIRASAESISQIAGVSEGRDPRACGGADPAVLRQRRLPRGPPRVHGEADPAFPGEADRRASMQ